MKRLWVILFDFISIFLLFSLSSCDTLSAVTSSATSTIFPSETATAIPATSTPEPSPTATQVPIPDYMDAYLEGGYDKKNTDQFLCFVIDENKVHISPAGGVLFNERRIFIWTEVDYIKAGRLLHSNVIVLMKRGGSGVQSDFQKITFSNSGASFDTGSEAFYRGIADGWMDNTEGEYPIACGLLGLETPEGDGLVDAESVGMDRFGQEGLESRGVKMLWEGLFPVVEGKALSVVIPGIGAVLPITEAFIIENQ